jgi:hypothetical protein
MNSRLEENTTGPLDSTGVTRNHLLVLLLVVNVESVYCDYLFRSTFIRFPPVQLAPLAAVAETTAPALPCLEPAVRMNTIVTNKSVDLRHSVHLSISELSVAFILTRFWDCRCYPQYHRTPQAIDRHKPPDKYIQSYGAPKLSKSSRVEEGCPYQSRYHEIHEDTN